MEKDFVELADKNATKSLGRKLASRVFPKPSLILISGGLGAGKTTLAQGFIEFLLKEPVSITSPTYSYVNVYETTPPIYHFDLYRLTSPNEIKDLGLLEQLFDDQALRLVEWPEHMPGLSQKADIHIFLDPKPHGRTASIVYFNSP